MKANKLLKTLAASAMSLALLASVTVMPAMAAGVTSSEGETSIPGITVTDVVTTDGKTYAPNTTMTINVTEGGGKTFNDGEKQVTAEAGVSGGLSGTTITFAPDTESAPQASYSMTGTLAVNDGVFSEPGIYHYVVTHGNNGYEGITYSAETYDVYLYVLNNTAMNDLYVKHAVCVKNGEEDTKAELTFTNNYGAGENDTTHDVTVTKQVTGNHGNMVSDRFNFDVSVSGADGEVYRVVVKETASSPEQTLTITSKAAATQVTVKHGGSITIYGLSATDSYTISETNGVELGYTVDNNKTNDQTGTVTGVTTQDGENYTVTNHKDASTPTGVIMNVAPYALMVVIAVAGVAVFMRKRVED